MTDEPNLPPPRIGQKGQKSKGPMTNEELEREIGHLATKEQLAQLEASLLKQIIASKRAQRVWIWGLYALIIVSFFVKH
jgi:hypothetical protein